MLPRPLSLLLLTALLITGALSASKALSQSTNPSIQIATATFRPHATSSVAATATVQPRPRNTGATIIYALTTGSPYPFVPPTPAVPTTSTISAKDSDSFIQ